MERLSEYTDRVQASMRTRSTSRALAAIALGALTNRNPQDVLSERHPSDKTAATILRTVAGPASTSTAAALLETHQGLLLSGIAPASRALRLFGSAMQLDFTGVHQYNIAFPETKPVPIFVKEAGPTPIAQARLGTATVGPMKKILIATAVTSQLEIAVGDTASSIVGKMFSDCFVPAFDGVVFGSAAADDAQPAGLLHDVTPLAAAGAGADAMAKDVGSIAAAIATAGGDADRMMIFAAPKQAVALRMSVGTRFTNPILSTNALADKQIVGVDPQMIGASNNGVPSIDISREATLHFEDTTPLPISADGTIAGPVRSAFQENLLALRMRMSTCWGVLAPGGVQTVVNVAWG